MPTGLALVWFKVLKLMQRTRYDGPLLAMRLHVSIGKFMGWDGKEGVAWPKWAMRFSPVRIHFKYFCIVWVD